MHSSKRVALRLLPLFALLLAGGASGCTNAVAPEKPEVDPLHGLGTGIHPVAVIGTSTDGTTRVAIHLKRVGVDIRVASYQAELSLSRGSLVRAELPEGIAGSWNEISPGTLRVAGAALEGIGDEAVLIAYVRAGEVRATDLRLRVEELTSTDGFSDASGLLSSSDHPVLTRSALR